MFILANSADTDEMSHYAVFHPGLYSLVYEIQKGPKLGENTPIIRKDDNGLKLKLIITSFNIRLLTLQKSVAA